MKLKKILAASLAIAMAATLNVVPAKADIIDSDTAYLNKEVYDVTLPTTTSQKFYLDPQGLSDAVFGPGNAGKIIGAATMSAINNSSMPVNMEVKAVVLASPGAITVTTGGSVSALDNVGSGPAISLKIATSSAKAGKVVSKGGIAAGTELTAADDVYAAITGSAISSQVYGLAAGDYDVVTKSAIDSSNLDEVFDSSKYEYKMSASGAAINLNIGGECTQKTDWSAFSDGTEELKLELTFKLTKEDLATEITVERVMKKNGKNVEYTFDAPVPTGKITKVLINGVSKPNPITNGNLTYSESSGKLTFIDSAVTTNLGTSGTKYTIVATIGGTDYTLTYTAP